MILIYSLSLLFFFLFFSQKKNKNILIQYAIALMSDPTVRTQLGAGILAHFVAKVVGMQYIEFGKEVIRLSTQHFHNNLCML